jgi:hypothetical protein
MNYILQDIHYKRIPYFDIIQFGDKFNVFGENHILIDIFDDILIVDVLNYVKFNNDIKYLQKHKIDNILEIFNYLMMEDYIYLNMLNNKDLEKNINDNMKDKIKEYNETFLINPKVSNVLFKLVGLSKKQIEILNDNNNIKEHIFYNLKDLEKYSNRKIFKCYIKFNKEIKEDVLPKTLTHLYFGYNFNQEIKENVLPKSLTHLYFCHNFNKEIKENVLPKSLTNLKLPSNYPHKNLKYIYKNLNIVDITF